VSCRGVPSIIDQRIRVGLRATPARSTTINVDEPSLCVYDQPNHLIKTVRRTSPKGGHPTQGLRSHHQPRNQLGTVTPNLKPDTSTRVAGQGRPDSQTGRNSSDGPGKDGRSSQDRGQIASGEHLQIRSLPQPHWHECVKIVWEGQWARRAERGARPTAINSGNV
jgi:hypothetical protein